MNDELLIYVYADENYELFVFPYIAFALTANPGAHVEVVLGNQKSKLLDDQAAIEALSSSAFKGTFDIRFSTLPSDFKATPNVRRFIEEPVAKRRYIYIGDIDLMLLDNVLDTHLPKINELNLDYSNVIRDPGVEHPRLTGLHFSLYENIFPIPNIEDLNLLTMNDEAVLYEIVRRKGCNMCESYKFRPELGVHMSLSRDPRGRTSGPKQSNFTKGGVGWGGDKYYKSLIQIFYSGGFLKLLPSLSVNFKLFILIIESIVEGQFERFEDHCFSYVVNRAKLVPDDQVALKHALVSYPYDKLYAAFPARNEVKKES